MTWITRPLMSFVLIVATMGTAFAAPLLIRDSRVTDLSTTPVLGRGYSMSTNTYQSSCLSDVVVTEPSYDFDYSFISVEKSKESMEKLKNEMSGSFSYFWVSGEVNASVENSTKRKKTSHHVLVTLNVNSYYASVDEASTSLSDSATALLNNQDLPGFFSACGPYYIRGITRNAQFVSIFAYETESTERDTKFEFDLKMHIRGFLGMGGGDYHVHSQGEFSNKASQKSLTITSRGWGLGKNEDASLISYDLETFKEAVKQAFISMQNPLTGRVESIEVVPWVENTGFQSLVNMRGTDVVSGKEVPLYEKKDILNFNAEFLSEVERAGRNRLAMFYKAKVCKNSIGSKWYDQGKLSSADAKLVLRNNRLMQPGITLGDLDKLLESRQITALWVDYEKFMYKDANSATSCLTELLKDPAVEDAKKSGTSASKDQGALLKSAESGGTGRGLYLKRFTSISQCQSLQKSFAAQLPEKIEDYCMPETL